MAISVGTGNYPPEILGETDLFGKGWLDIRGTFRRAHRFIKMLSTAVRREGRSEGGRRERKGRKEGGKEGGSCSYSFVSTFCYSSLNLSSFPHSLLAC